MGIFLRRRGRWIVAWGAFLALAGWLGPPLVRVERYRRQLKSELERELGRPVDFGKVSVRLLPRPGFSIENVLVGEAPEFGSEPFARIDRVDCDVRWQSLWHDQFTFDRLVLERPSFNLVRNDAGVWNVRSLLVRPSPPAAPAGPAAGLASPGGHLILEADDARLDFKVGANKKPFAVTRVRGRLDLDIVKGSVSFRLAGQPIRTDLSLPTPGQVEAEGNWTPGENLSGPLAATVRTQGTLLYDWAPIVTGRNPDLYGIVDARTDLRGSIYAFQFEASGAVRQVRRLALPPPADPMPILLTVRGQFDRSELGRLVVESAEAHFRDTTLHASGNIEQVFSSPRLDLAVAVEHSRIENFFELARRFAGGENSTGVFGRVDGLITVRGPWREPSLSGFFKGQGARLAAGGASFPLSDIDLGVDESGVRLEPVRVTLAPRVELVAEGGIRRPALPVARTKGRSLRRAPAVAPHSPEWAGLQYHLSLSAKGVPVRELVRFGRLLGIRTAQELDAQGTATVSSELAGNVWPFALPAWRGEAQLHSARLFVPGLTEPVNIPRAKIQMSENKIVADPVTAVIGTSVFTGRLEHQGDRNQPWVFDARASHLSLDQSALWFDVLGHRPPLPLLERIPGIRSLLEQRTTASSLFTGLNARGEFRAAAVTYRGVTLTDVRGSAAIAGRVVRLGVESFRAGGGRGAGKIKVDLTLSPPHVVVDAQLNGAAIAPLANRLPPALEKARGVYSASGHFEMRGLTAGEISSSIHGQATLRLRDVSFSGFDPAAALARVQARTPEPARGDATLRSATLALRIEDQRVTLGETPVSIGGSQFGIRGFYEFGGTADLSITPEGRRASSSGELASGESASGLDRSPIRLSGPLNHLTLARPVEALRRAP